MKPVYFIIIVLLLCNQIACREKPVEDASSKSANKEGEVNLSKQELEQAHLTTDTALFESIHEILKVNGIVDVPPQNIVSISFPMGGYLRSTKLLPGMHVSRGEVIGVMEDQSLIQLQQDFLMAVSRYAFIQQEYARQQELRQNNVNAEKVFQQTESEYKGQRILVRALEEKLKLIGINTRDLTEEKISRSVPIYSPINGFVSKVNVNTGKYVNATDVLFELINPDDIHAALTVFERDMPKIRVGQKVKVSIADQPLSQFDCEVILLTRNVDQNRSGIVHCHFDKIPRNFLPGMFLNAEVQLRQFNAFTVPEPAIVMYENKQYLFVSSGSGNFKLLEVKTGLTMDDRIELVNFPAELSGKQIVSSNAYALLGKMKKE